MRDQILLPETGLYKANLHCHTTVSDGRLTPEEIKELYMSEGYSIVAYTDHREYVWHKELDDENFLALPSMEADLTEKGDYWPTERTFHFNLYDTRPSKDREGGDYMPHCDYHDKTGINEYIARMVQEGFLVCYNHPYWSLQDVTDYCDLEGLFAMEIYNHGSELEGMYGFSPQAYDEMLRSGQRIYCVAADDNHNVFPKGDVQFDALGGCTYIAAESLTQESVIDALKNGRFYWSTGPKLLGMEIRDDVLRVKCSPVEKLYVIQNGRNYYRKTVHPGESFTEAEFKLSGQEGWFRVEIRDARGQAAGSRAYFTDELQ